VAADLGLRLDIPAIRAEGSVTPACSLMHTVVAEHIPRSVRTDAAERTWYRLRNFSACDNARSTISFAL
jgi:hypothetical protein